MKRKIGEKNELIQTVREAYNKISKTLFSI